MMTDAGLKIDMGMPKQRYQWLVMNWQTIHHWNKVPQYTVQWIEHEPHFHINDLLTIISTYLRLFSNNCLLNRAIRWVTKHIDLQKKWD